MLRTGWEGWHAQNGHDTSSGLPFDGLATLQLLEHNPFFRMWGSPLDTSVRLVSLKWVARAAGGPRCLP